MKKKFLKIIVLISTIVVVFAGCGTTKNTDSSSGNSTQLTKVTLGTYNGTCEAPLYVGIEKGIFKKHGLDVKLQNINAETLKEGIASGKIAGAQISPGMFKSMEQGLDIKLTTGVHTGCIQGVVPVNSPIKDVKGLKGKTIGIDSIGGVPMVLLSIELGKYGIDPKKDVQWRVYPQPQLAQALEKGEIDAFAAWDPYGALAVSQGKARKIFGNSNNEKGKEDSYCCYVGVNGKLADKDPKLVKALTDSWVEADAWVQAHPQEAGKLIVDKKYVSSGDEKENAKLLGTYKFVPDKAKSKKDFTNTLNAMKAQGIIDSSTDVNALVKSTLIDY
ncbi:ABC transporter substrate-binding protein [Clostridium luticellarii]|uniref:ABC transporter substrate-binding protein n=1 Tax=Clostridium luticellarii TaxID=1691940 RepID=UPI0023541672|nr:ABC transporter substrate-binding protein [Clostridium luticellarii]MCI1946231.1 ABC transporter substrate-binding protein [Clostridium luticellarii]MCI1969530.1 ABC transporter substrate-binding protein [Clostridium luticellarii]MCI1996724.1 ABC transporter substrate-binding protein [Clostridium luticellarii]MCI2041000.1 ABC transporter substrate-binding protein [Clostridium luticellarii]